MVKKSHRDLVKSYYRFVDDSNFESLFLLFAKDVVYRRCENKITGIAGLKKFYKKERTIRGKHKLENIVVEGKNVAVHGTFKGTNGFGNKVDLAFADFFVFNKRGKIAERFTYLADGYEMTK